MQNCPRCRQPADDRAVTCPYCRTPLKAYGHPGIPLHRAVGEESLCESCTYHADDTCTFPQRPYARECTLYQDVSKSQLDVKRRYTSSPAIAVRNWVRRHQVWLILLGLLFVSFLIAL